jgi:hypothetical protein
VTAHRVKSNKYRTPGGYLIWWVTCVEAGCTYRSEDVFADGLPDAMRRAEGHELTHAAVVVDLGVGVGFGGHCRCGWASPPAGDRVDAQDEADRHNDDHGVTPEPFPISPFVGDRVEFNGSSEKEAS